MSTAPEAVTQAECRAPQLTRTAPTGCVLVHCHEGKNRSAALLIAYLMVEERMRLAEAVEQVDAQLLAHVKGDVELRVPRHVAHALRRLERRAHRRERRADDAVARVVGELDRARAARLRARVPAEGRCGWGWGCGQMDSG